MPIKVKPNLNPLNKGQITVGGPVNNPKVLYPTKQLESKQDGWALVKLDIDENGSTKNVGAVDCSPVFSFCYAAEKYFTEAQYHPPLKDGKHIKVIEHYFILNFFVDGGISNHLD
jgi:outer membrane biosynthesis protein TonB